MNAYDGRLCSTGHCQVALAVHLSAGCVILPVTRHHHRWIRRTAVRPQKVVLKDYCCGMILDSTKS